MVNKIYIIQVITLSTYFNNSLSKYLGLKAYFLSPCVRPKSSLVNISHSDETIYPSLLGILNLITVQGQMTFCKVKMKKRKKI